MFTATMRSQLLNVSLVNHWPSVPIILHDASRPHNESSYLDLFDHVGLHDGGYLVDVLVGVVVHDGVLEHEHHVAVELLRGADHAVLDVLLDGDQVNGTHDDALVTRCNVFRHRMEKHICIPVGPSGCIISVQASLATEK